MISLRKRGPNYHVDYSSGPVRLRGPLGTTDPKSAKRLTNRIGFAMSDGPRSEVWQDLRASLPPRTWKRFCSHSGVSDKPIYTWGDLLSIFWKENSKGWAKSTARGYDRTMKTFGEFLPKAEKTLLTDISKSVIEAYRAAREKATTSTPQYRNGASLEKEMTLLRQMFTFAKEEGMVESNPVKKEKSVAVSAVTQPFTDEDLSRLSGIVTQGDDDVLYMVLRGTGLRGSDIADLKWADVHFADGEIRRTMVKTGKEVIIPLSGLLDRCLSQYRLRVTTPEVFPYIKNRAALYRKVQEWGKAAKVDNCRPHRFRDSLAVTILLRGGTMYDVAKILGITVAVAEKHYTPFVPELRSRLRGLLDQEESK